MNIKELRQYDAECSECSLHETGNSRDFRLVREFEDYLRQAGWTEQSGRNLCPNCTEKLK